jgi:hypothetical protein
MIRTVSPRSRLPLAVPVLLALTASSPAQVVTPEQKPGPKEFECVEPPADGIPVLVVDPAGKPAAGAYVTWFDEKADPPQDLAPEPALKDLRRVRGRTVVTDEHGATRIGEFRRVVASAAGAYAVAWYAPGSEPLALKLVMARTLSTTAVNADGNPVPGVTICLREREQSNGSYNEWRVKTGSDGAATVGPIDLFTRIENASELYVAVDGPLAKPIIQRITPRELPAQPLRFVMPPTGRLVVDVVDADGRPLDSVERIDVREPYRSTKDSLPATQQGIEWLSVPSYSATASTHYEFDHVGLGLQFVLAAEADAIEPVEQTVVGPTRAGETVAVKLVGSPRDCIRARLIDERGVPVANRFVELLWMTDLGYGGRESLGSAKSDAEGRVAIPLSGRGRRRYANAVDQWVEFVARDGDEGRVRYEAIFPLPKSTRLEAHDLDNVRLHEVARLVRGTIVDDAGAPVSGAKVSVVIPVVLKPGEGYRGPAYGREPALRATSGADGTFEIYGDAPVGRLALLAEPADRRAVTPLQESAETGFEPGATDAKVVLWRCGTIVGRVVGDPDEISTLSWRVESERADGNRTSSACGFNDRDGSFDDTVPIGKATVAITRRGTPIAKFADLEVKPGAVLRLPPVELSASAHQCELTIVDELGKPVPAGWIALPDPDEERQREEARKMFPPSYELLPRRLDITPFKDGQSMLRSDQELRPFAVGALGRVAVVVMHPNTAERAVLEPAPKVSVQLEYEGDPLPEAFSFQVTLAIPAADPAFFRNGPDRMSTGFWSYPRLDDIELTRGKPVELPIRSLGPLDVTLNLYRKRENGLVGSWVETDLKQIDVKRGAAEVFHVRVERAAIEAAIRRLNDLGDRESR